MTKKVVNKKVNTNWIGTKSKRSNASTAIRFKNHSNIVKSAKQNFQIITAVYVTCSTLLKMLRITFSIVKDVMVALEGHESIYFIVILVLSVCLSGKRTITHVYQVNIKHSTVLFAWSHESNQEALKPHYPVDMVCTWNVLTNSSNQVKCNAQYAKNQFLIHKCKRSS